MDLGAEPPSIYICLEPPGERIFLSREGLVDIEKKSFYCKARYSSVAANLQVTFLESIFPFKGRTKTKIEPTSVLAAFLSCLCFSYIEPKGF